MLAHKMRMGIMNREGVAMRVRSEESGANTEVMLAMVVLAAVALLVGFGSLFL